MEVNWRCDGVQAVQVRQEALRAAQLSYTDAAFHVELVQQSDVSNPATIATGEHHMRISDPPRPLLALAQALIMRDFQALAMASLSHDCMPLGLANACSAYM